MCAPKLRTPSTSISSRPALTVTRRIASSEVPGFSTQCIRKSYSWKFGRNSSPRNGNAAAVTASETATIAIARLGAAISPGSDPPVPRLQAA